MVQFTLQYFNDQLLWVNTENCCTANDKESKEMLVEIEGGIQEMSDVNVAPTKSYRVSFEMNF